MSRSSAAERAEPVEVPPLCDFRIDGWLVEATRNRLVKGAADLRVRPQLIDVLACLARRPGAVVPKATLLAEVWRDRYIAESGIARCVAELRHLLADDARQPRVIETIPKRGYRLIVPVEPVPRLEAAGTAFDTAGRPAPVSAPPWSAAARSSVSPVVSGAGAIAGRSSRRGHLVSAARSLLAAAAGFAQLTRHFAARVVL